MEGLLRVYELENDTIKSKLYWVSLIENYLNFHSDKKDKTPTFVINLKNKEIRTYFNDQLNAELIEIYDENNFNFNISPNEAKDFDVWNSSLKKTCQIYRPRDIPKSTFKSDNTKYKSTNRDSIDAGNSRHSSGPVPKPRMSVQNNYPNQNGYRQTDQIRKESRNSPAPNSRRESRNMPIENKDNLRQHEIKPDYHAGYRSSGYPESRRSSQVPQSKDGRRRDSRQNEIRPDYQAGYRSSGYPESRRSSHKPQYPQNNTRIIDPVKEDPSMSDRDVFTSRPPPTVFDTPRKYSMPESIKRWSIAATDLVGKSVEELYLMLIQMNRLKANYDIGMAHEEKKIEMIDEELKRNLRSAEREELERERDQLQNNLDTCYELLDHCDPIIQLLDSVVQMSGVYAGDNQMFHVVYHDEPAAGNEDFSNIEFVRHNQEKQIAKLLDDYKVHNQNNWDNMIPYEEDNDDNDDDRVFSSRRSTLRKSSKQAEERRQQRNNETIKNLPWNHSENFHTESRNYNLMLDSIDTSILELDPTKKDLESFMNDYEYGRSLRSINKNEIDDNKENNYTKTTVANLKSGKSTLESQTMKPALLDPSAFKPRRSTRKSPKSDMAASLNRMVHYKKTNIPYKDIDNSFLNSIPMYTNLNPSKQRISSSNSPSDQMFQPSLVNANYTNPQDVRDTIYQKRNPSLGHSSNSKVQNHLQDILNTQPYEEKPQYTPRIPSSRNSIQNSPVMDINNDEPLIKLNPSRYSSMHRQSQGQTSLRSESISLAQTSHVSSINSENNFEVNQRLHLNEMLDDQKMWKNPSKNRPELHSPAKINIGERYEPSDVDELENGSIFEGQYGNEQERSSRIRRIVAAGAVGNDSPSYSIQHETPSAGINYRENQLKQQSILAKEASRKSRQL